MHATADRAPFSSSARRAIRAATQPPKMLAEHPRIMPIRYSLGSSVNARVNAALLSADESDWSIRANRKTAIGASRIFVPTMSLVAPSTTPFSEMSLNVGLVMGEGSAVGEDRGRARGAQIESEALSP